MNTPDTQKGEGAAPTPTPWNLHPVYDGAIMAVPEQDGRPAFVAASLVIARGEQIIAEVKMQAGAQGGFPTVESHAEMVANAEFIIRSVNESATLHAQIARLNQREGELVDILRNTVANGGSMTNETLFAARAALSSVAKEGEK